MALTRAQLIDGALARFPGLSNQVASAIRESYATGALSNVLDQVESRSAAITGETAVFSSKFGKFGVRVRLPGKFGSE